MNKDFIKWVMENKIEITDHYIKRCLLDLWTLESYDGTKIKLYSMLCIGIKFTHMEKLKITCTPNSNLG
jgi:hypothetical protein